MPGARVLMIDDSELALEVQLMLLRRKGFEVCGCLGITEMKEAATSFTPDVVITDVGLGDVTIEQACAAIRATFGTELPVLLYSGLEDHELAVLVDELGVDGFINKADRPGVVVSKIEAVLGADRA